VKRFWTRRFFRATLLTQAWPLLLFLLVILIPTACLLWFMNAAMQNERLAFRQRLADVYRAHLPSWQMRLHDYWNAIPAEIEKLSLDPDPPAAFARAVQSGLVDSIILFDAEGRYIYPNAPTVVATEIPELEPKWADAARFENLRRDFATAAKAYEAIAIQATNANIAARARQAQARCFLQGGLKVYTTEDPNLQPMADDAVANGLRGAKAGFGAALVAMDPKTGYVKAMADNRPFNQSKFNLATDGAGGQVGSSFKVTTLATVLANGYSRNDQIDGNASNTPPPCAPSDANCVLQRRIGVSAAFFVESEFQETGGYVYRLYRSSLGRRPIYTEFMIDRLRVVGGPNLAASKQLFADKWVQRSALLQKYPSSLSGPDSARRSTSKRQPRCLKKSARRSRGITCTRRAC